MTAETIVGHSDTPPSMGLTIAEDRRKVGLEAAWELEALAEATYDLCRKLGAGDPPDQTDLMALRLKIRGLTVRVGQLAGVVMSVLGDDDTTHNLFHEVHGHWPQAEVAHG